MTVALVTGGTGFLGRRIAQRLLDEGWRVALLVRPSSAIPAALRERTEQIVFDGDLHALSRGVRGLGPNVVLHLASMIVVDHQPEQTTSMLRSNIEMPTLLLEAMVAAGCRAFVNTGTFWQHYEGRPYWPVDLYAATKQAFEALLLHYVDRHSVHAVTLKLFETYGQDDVRRKIVGLLVDAARSGEPLDMSAGEQTLDLTHVDDVAEAFLVAARRAMQDSVCLESFFVSGDRIRLRDLVSAVEALAGPCQNIRLGRRPYRLREIMEPIDPAGAVLPGWSRRIALADELAKAVAPRAGR